MKPAVVTTTLGLGFLLLMVLLATTPAGAALAVLLTLAPVVGLAVLTRYTLAQLGAALVTVGVALTPLFSGSWSVGSGTFGDLFLAAGFLVLFPTIAGHRLVIPASLLVGIFVLFSATLLSLHLSSYGSLGVIRTISMMLHLIALPLLFLWWAPSRRVIRGLAFAFVVGQALSTILPMLAGQFSTTRMQGLTTHPNAFGTCAVFAIAMLVFLFFEWPLLRRWIVIALVGLNVLGVIFSGSRAALVALGVLSIVVVIREGSGWVMYAYSSVLVGILVATPLILSHLSEDSAPNRLLHPDQTSAGGSNEERASLLSDGWHAFVNSPIIGSGIGDAETTFFHNVPLQMAVAAGILGLLGWLAVQLSTLSPLLLRSSRFRLGYIGVVYLITSQLSPTVTVRWIWIPLCLAILGHGTHDDDDADTVSESPGTTREGTRLASAQAQRAQGLANTQLL